MRVSQKVKNLIILSSTILLTIALLISAIVFKGFSTKVAKKNVNAEIAKSKTYAQVADGEDATNSDNVKFDAFFLRDLDLDGNAEKLRGSCRQIGQEDTLYMEVNVLGEGYLKDAKITINNGNYYLKTEIVKDREVAENVLTEKATEINFNKLNNGTQKLLFGGVRSGYYNSSDRVAEAIGNKPENYSKENTITLTGTHVIEDEEGQIISETQVEKEVRFDVDWYGENRTIFESKYQTVEYEGDSVLSEEGLVVEAKLNIKEDKGQLINKKAHVEGTIPTFNGYSPISVEIKNKPEDVTFTYNDSTGEFELYKENEILEGGELSAFVGRAFYNTIKIVYPREAYENVDADTVEVSIPVKAYFESYNNDDMEGINSITKSNEAEATIEVLYTRPRGQEVKVDVNVYNSDYFGEEKVSKIKPLNIYNGVSASESNDNYYVEWRVYAGTEGNIQSVVLKEADVDKFIKDDSTEVSMDDLTTTVGLSFSRIARSLGDDGWIKVYNDDTDELINVYYSDDWGYSQRFAEPVKHVRIETSAVSQLSDMSIYLKKELDDEYIVNNFTREEFDKLSYIKAQLQSYINGVLLSNTIDVANYEEPESYFSIGSSIREFSTQEEKKDVVLTIETKRPYTNESLWKDGIFLIELPEEVAQIRIKDVTVNSNRVTIDSYEIIEQNNKNYIKVYTSNDDKDLYKISITCDLVPNPKANTISTYMKAWAVNKENENYYRNVVDEFDLDNDGNVEEKVGRTDLSMNFISPNSLLISQEAHDYSDLDEYTIAPRIAEVSKDQRTAKVQLNLNNNYANTVSNVMILGKIPYENNTYVLSNNDVGSDYSTTMTNEGITVPERFAEKAKVYYSTKENPTKDISNSANGWTLTPSDFSQVKSYLIDISEYVIERGTDESFTYNIQLPTGVEFEKVSYSVFAVYFALDTADGKYYTQTEPAKLGFKVVKKYNLELTKYQKNANKKVSGATYLLTQEKESEEDEEINKTAGTREGIASFSDLYINRTYTLKELLSPDEYELNEDEVRFRTYIENGETKIEILDGTTKSAEIIKLQGEDYKAAISVEDKVRANIEIVKTDKDTDEELEGVKYKVSGKGIAEDGIIITTNAEGKALLNGLYIDEEYTLEEVKAEDYYLLDPVKFVIHENNGEYSVEVTEGTIESTDDREENSIPVMILNVEDEAIPSYTLKVIKKELGKDINLSGARFRLVGEDKNEVKYLYTDENGEINISGLYQYIDGKYITGKYTLQEIEAPEGYMQINDVKFKVTNENNTLKVEVEEGTIKESEVNGTTVTIVLEDSANYKIHKVDENNRAIEGVKFSIFEVNDAKEIVDYAKNSKGEYLGTLDNEGRYVLTTDANGDITLPLRNGKYKVREVETLDEYELSPENILIEVGGQTQIPTRVTDDVVEINSIEDLLDVSLNVLDKNNYAGKTVKLMRDLNFSSVDSYDDATRTDYGDLNGDDQTDSLYDELMGTNGIGFVPIGYTPGYVSLYSYGFDTTYAFQGIFDGQNHSISDFCVDEKHYGKKIKNIVGDSDAFAESGLFGAIINAEINNLNLYYKTPASGNVKGYRIGIVGIANDSKINNVNLYGDIVLRETSNAVVGGMVAVAYRVDVNNCKAYGSIINLNNNGSSSSIKLGGIIGTGSNVNLNNCYSEMDIATSNTSNYLGGMAASLSDSTVTNCVNKGDLNCTLKNEANDAGGIVASIGGYVEIKNCINYGDIEGGYSFRAGGILGYVYNARATIDNCHNYGNISTIPSSGGTYGASGGIVGRTITDYSITIKNSHNSGIIGTYISASNSSGHGDMGGIQGLGNAVIEKCYNDGDIVYEGAYSPRIGGISGGNGGVTIKDCYNTGNINVIDSHNGNNSYVQIGGIVLDGNIINSYNTGNITITKPLSTESYYTAAPVRGTSNSSGTLSNAYYLDSIQLPEGHNTVGTAVSDEYMRSSDFLEDLNSNNAWIQEDGEYPTLKFDINNSPINNELKIKNKFKNVNIKTRVQTINNVSGGSISGGNLETYEAVKYGNNSTKEIKMVPYTNFEITSISINGKGIEFTPEEDGTYTLPLFENMTEDKLVVVTFGYRNSRFIINKTDAETGENIKEEGIKFNVEQLSYLANPSVGELVDNAYVKQTVEYDSEVTGKIGALTPNGDYYFVEEDGKYVPTNSKTYQLAHGGEGGIDSSYADSYLEIDLTDMTGLYVVEIDARISSESGYDEGYAFIREDTAVPSDSNGMFMYISGEGEGTSSSDVFEGGSKYYLHLGYYKDSSGSDYEDRVVINSIKLYPVSEEAYSFTNNNGIYESTNQGQADTRCDSFVPVDLRGLLGTYTITVNASISSEENDKGYIFISSSTSRMSTSNTSSRIGLLSGEIDGEDYICRLTGGNIYYIHFVYEKDDQTDGGNDKFTINSCTLENPDLYNFDIETNSNGQAMAQVPFGRYKITELSAPDGYAVAEEPMYIDFVSETGMQNVFSFENQKAAKVITNHKIATRNDDGTYNYTDNEIAESSTQEDAVGKSYTTSPKVGLEKYELITDENGKEILPDNAAGEYTVDDINVNYYYVKKQVPLTVNHYIVGTTTPVPSRSGSVVLPEEDKGDEGEEYTTNRSAEVSEDYELVEVPRNATGDYEFPEVNVDYFYQPIERNIIIRKLSEDGETRLEGAKFRLYDNTGSYTEYTTDVNGEFRVKLAAGVYRLEETEAPAGYDLDTTIIDIDIAEETEDYKVFEIVNNQKRGTLKVNHYVMDNEGNKTTTRITDINGDEVQEISKIGIIGAMWATKPYEEAATKYEIAEEPDVAYGDYIDGEIVVNYYYRLKDTKVIVHHYIQENDGTQTTDKVPSNVEGEVVEDVTINGKVDDEYHTSAATNISDDYELVSTPRDAEGTMTEDQIELTYYYALKNAKAVARYVDLYAEIVEEGDTDEIAERQTKTGKIGDEYETDQKEIEGYTFIRSTDNTEGTLTLEDIDVVYYYAPNTYVTVRYLEKGSDDVLSPEVTKEGFAGKEFETEEETIDNYTLVEVDGPVSGTMTKAPITTTYYYLQNTKARVEYIDRTDNHVMEYIEQTGLVGDEFVTEAKEFENYILVESPEETTVNMTKDMITLRYYYIKNNASLTVRYINVLTGTVIDSDIETGKTVGDEYTTTAKNLEGYEVVGELNGHDYTPTNATGTYSNEPITVDYYYIRKASVTARYIDKMAGEELAEDVVINGYENDPYQTEEKTFRGYVLDSVDGNTNSIMNITTDEDGNVVTNKVVTYYYKKASTVIVNHIDVNTDEILSVERRNGYEGDNYSTTSKKIKSYDLVEDRLPENKDGKFARDEQVVNYYYIKKLTVVVEYLDKITGARLAVEDKIEGHEGDTYTTTPKELLGYEVVGVPKNASGTMQVAEKDDGTFENEIRVTYYYKIPCRVVVEYIDKETGKKLTTSTAIEGYENDEYETKAKEFDGYELIQTPDNAKGIMKVQLNENKETTEIVVRYYYAKKATGTLPQTGEDVVKNILYITAFITYVGIAIAAYKKFRKGND